MTDVLRDLVLSRLDGVREQNGTFVARCPAHEDHTPSLSIRPGREHPVMLKCFAGCELDDILAALDLSWSDLCTPREQEVRSSGEWTPAGPASEVYDYCDEAGNLLYQVLRIPEPDGGKTFRQRVPDRSQRSGWAWSLGSVRIVPYRLPELLAAVHAGEPVWCVEGERDVRTLARHGVAATCNSMGSGCWRPEFADLFAGAQVTIVADRDRPGQKHAREVAASLAPVAGSLRTVEAVIGNDITDHLGAGKRLDEVLVTWSRDPVATVDLAPDLDEFLAVVDPPQVWVIPDLLERSDRLIFTGTEGGGKSTMVRILAVSAAAGVQPFTDEQFDPQRVLFIDCENTERQSRRHFRTLRDIAVRKGRPVPRGQMHLIHRPAGLDLARRDDAAWLVERVTAHRPDLLVCGPFYKLHASEKEDEHSARGVTDVFDAIRDRFDCAFVFEHHAPHGDAKNRDLRPFGSSLFRRWPEMGMGIAPASEEVPCRNVVVKRWRPDRDQRFWPRALRWGTGQADWPWVIDEQHAKEWG